MFNVITGGCNTRHPKTFFMSRTEGLNNYLLLIVKTHANFTINTTNISVLPGSVIIIDRKTPYCYHNPNGDYVNDWLHFDCDDDTLKKHSFKLNEFYLLTNLKQVTTLIQQILWERAYTPAHWSKINIDLLGKLLINHLFLAYKSRKEIIKYNPYLSKLQALRLSIQNAPCEKYNIDEVASSMAISTSYFQHIYTRLFKISFHNDLIRMRIEYAKFLIETTDFTIAKVSEVSGYTSDVHFYRQFKKITGHTPSEYRELALQ
jgi:AraC family transcriptional regulator of arabinose operon